MPEHRGPDAVLHEAEIAVDDRNANASGHERGIIVALCQRLRDIFRATRPEFELHMNMWILARASIAFASAEIGKMLWTQNRNMVLAALLGIFRASLPDMADTFTLNNGLAIMSALVVFFLWLQPKLFEGSKRMLALLGCAFTQVCSLLTYAANLLTCCSYQRGSHPVSAHW